MSCPLSLVTARSRRAAPEVPAHYRDACTPCLFSFPLVDFLINIRTNARSFARLNVRANVRANVHPLAALLCYSDNRKGASPHAPRSLTTTYATATKGFRHSQSRRHSHKCLSNSSSSNKLLCCSDVTLLPLSLTQYSVLSTQYSVLSTILCATTTTTTNDAQQQIPLLLRFSISPR
jgi:hypothetical protein